MKTNPTLGEQIRAARLAAGLTQVALSEAASVPQNTISAWERGITRPGTDAIWERLCEALSVRKITDAAGTRIENLP